MPDIFSLHSKDQGGEQPGMRRKLASMPPHHNAENPDTIQSRAEEIAVSLRNSITAGEFAPGYHLAEVVLAKRYDTSRNTLREAFKILSEQRLVTQVPNRGTSVAVPTLMSILDIYRVRRLIEVPAVASSYPLHPGIQRMNDAIEDASRAAENDNWNQVGTANIEFHAAVISLTHSPILKQLFERLFAELRLAFGIVARPDYLHTPFLGKNREIVNLIQQGSGLEASRLLDTYLIESERLLLAAYGD